MKTIHFFFAIAVVFNFFQVHAQQENPMRQVLFTMRPNEVLVCNEFYVETTFAADRFAAVVADTASGERSFIFNGDRIATDGYGYLSIEYADPTIRNGYGFSYAHPSGLRMINIGGKEFGPFNMATYDFYCTGIAKYAFKYTINLHGEEKTCFIVNNKEYGPFDGGDFICSDDIGSDEFTFEYTANGRWFAVCKGNVLGPYVDRMYSDPYSFSNDGKKYIKFAGYVINGNGCYIDVNGTTRQIEGRPGSLQINNDGHYAFTFSKYQPNEQNFINHDGQIIPVPSITKVRLSDHNNYMAYSYEKDTLFYVQTDTQLFGPYAGYFGDLIVSDDGHVKFSWYQAGIGYLLFDSRTGLQQEFDADSDSYTKNGMFYFITRDQYSDYKIDENGVSSIERKFQLIVNYDYDPYGHSFTLTTPDKKHTFRTSYERADVIIDNRHYVPSAAMRAWYDAQKHAFLWNAVDGQDLVVYTFKLYD